MRYRILIPCLLIFGISAYGQPSFGIKAGLNFNDIIVENAPWLPINLYRPSIGFHLGVISEFRLMNPLTFNPELIFIQKGANSSGKNGGINRINLNYLELPLLLSFNSTRLVSFQLGPNLGLRISAKRKTDGGKSDLKELFNKPFDFGVSGGLKLNLSNKISITGRYYYGLISPLKFQFASSTTYPPPSSSNRNLQIGMSYMLRK